MRLKQLVIRSKILSGDGSERLSIEEIALGLAENAISAMIASTLKTEKRDSARARGDLVFGVQRLLDARFKESLELEDLSKMVTVSPYYLARVFKAQTGISIHRYRTRLRMHEAMERVPAGRVDIVELALDLGYSTHSHFTKMFRKEFGMTPSVARRIVMRAPIREGE